MANIKISQLIAAGAASGTQEFEVNDSGTSKKVTGSQIKTYVKDGFVVSDVDDLTATAAELNTLDGITASTAELNTLTGLTASTTELNYVDGVTSAIQTQLDAKYDSDDLASQAEAQAGIDNTKLMTPVRTDQAIIARFNVSGSAPVFACRAWVNFNGTGTVAIRGSGNVSSITDNGTGDYTVNFNTALPDANYAVAGTPQSGYGFGIISTASGSVRVRTPNFNNTAVDTNPVCVSVFR